MYHIVLAASHLTVSPRKASEDEYYETYGAQPFAGVAAALCGVVTFLQRLWLLRRAARSRARRPAAVL